MLAPRWLGPGQTLGGCRRYHRAKCGGVGGAMRFAGIVSGVWVRLGGEAALAHLLRFCHAGRIGGLIL